MRRVSGFFLLLTALLFPLCQSAAQDPPPAVHALFFYSPTCPHCHDVIAEYLLPMQERYGSRLVILGFDTSRQFANNLFYSTLRHFSVPQDRWAVPLLVVGDQVLVGGLEIPSLFPSIVEEGLAAGGIDYPDFPALLDFLRAQDMLDPQYPDRRVAPQRSLLEEEAPVADTAVVEDTAVTGDSGVVGNSIRPAPEDSASPGAADTLLADVQDTAAVRPEDTAAASPGDTVALGPIDTAVVEPVDTPATTSRDSPVHEAGDSARERPPEPAGADTSPLFRGDTPGAAPAPRRGASAGDGAVGLAEAMRSLESMTWRDRFFLDTAGNTLAVVVLLGMVVSLFLTGYPPRVRRKEWPRWLVPVLVVVGVVVAAYLSFVEVTQTEAVCGPVGDCNTVNQSEYAILFGVLPVGVLGLVGYAVILTLWSFTLVGSERVRAWAALGLWGAALFGTLFSIYLTFLEPFVIGATCLWCLSSAVVMTLILWVAAPAAARVWPGGSRSSEVG